MRDILILLVGIVLVLVVGFFVLPALARRRAERARTRPFTGGSSPVDRERDRTNQT